MVPMKPPGTKPLVGTGSLKHSISGFHKVKSIDHLATKVIEQVEADLIKSMGIPPECLGATNASSCARLDPHEIVASVRKYREKAERVMHRELEVHSIECRLPNWITTHRHKLARRLWVARGVFAHNLRAMAEIHRLPRSPE